MGVALALAVLVAIFMYLHYRGKNNPAVQVSGTGVSAFAKIAEAEGKILAAQAKANLQKEAALAVHATIDEVHSILG